VFAIWTNTTADLETIQPDVARWAAPSLAILRGTALGEADFRSYNPEVARYSIRDGKPDFANPVPRDQWRSLGMQEHSMRFSTSDRFHRSRFPGWAQSDFDRVKAFCADQPR
jgi:hypothetical protein